MTILNHNFSAPAWRLAAATIVLGTIGFLCGFLLALTVSAYSLYSCVQIM
jgi:tetrahydromethanopterin S-methyltransferase subunit F